MKDLTAFLLMIFFTVMANLLMKIGAVPNNVKGNIFSIFLSWKIILGLSSFAVSSIIYVGLLRTMPLSIAQTFAAFQFIAVILASWVILGESISLIKLLGMLLIAVGIIIVGLYN